MKTYLAICGWLLVSLLPAYGQNIFTVNSVLDHTDANPGDGQCLTMLESCTLRAAIEEANATGNAFAGPDEIHFSTSLQAPTLIRIGRNTNLGLPSINDNVVIDGTTGSGSHVIIDMDNRPNEIGFALEAGSDGSVLRGLVIGNGLIGILLLSDENLIEQNLIGIAPSGVDVENGIGIQIDGASGNRIRENIIALNGSTGITITSGSENNIIAKNLIGVDAEGAPQPNERGIFDEGRRTFIGGATQDEGNIFGGAHEADILLLGAESVVRYNMIGVGPGGARLGAGEETGVVIETDDHVLLDNTIAFKRFFVESRGDRYTLKRNFIGTNAAGDDLAIPAPGLENIGILIRGGEDILIGGTRMDGNTIGLVRGTALYMENVANSYVRGNFIGGDAAGDDMGNDGYGIFLTGASFQNTIGYGPLDTLDTALRYANVIAYNGSSGIAYEESAGAFNTSLRGNRIHDNGLEGIDLHVDGPTPNDERDLDEGANFLQNYPVISEAGYNAGRDAISVAYSIDSDNTVVTYPLTVDIYIADDPGSGEGQTYLGTHIYTIPNATERVDFPAVDLTWEATDVLVMTATDPFGNTSEFSAVSNAIGERVSQVSIEEADEAGLLTAGFALSAAYPNPFNPQTNFTLQVEQHQSVRLTVHDLLGRTVALIHDAPLAAQTPHTFTFDAAGLASGSYILRVAGEHFVETRNLLLTK